MPESFDLIYLIKLPFHSYRQKVKNKQKNVKEQYNYTSKA